jgi:hypothetical protein
MIETDCGYTRIVGGGGYRASGKLVRKSLGTTNAKIAKDKLKETEYLLATKRLGLPSKTPLEEILSDYYAHMRAHKEKKSAESDISRLRIFFRDVWRRRCKSRALGAAEEK